MENWEYRIIRSRRKTFSMQIDAQGLLLRVPLGATQRQIEQFLREHTRWIETHLGRLEQQKTAAQVQPLSKQELKALAEQAKAVIPRRVAYYAPLVGVTYGRITIRCQQTRWGSCSAKGNLNFNCLLMLAPPQVLDSVVVHELCHRRHMNHSERFYDEVLRVFPEYHKWHGWLKENGKALMLRAEKTKQEEAI